MGSLLSCLKPKNLEKKPMEERARISIKNKYHRFALFGPGESGKSTFLKQMINNFKHGYPADERVRLKPAILQNIVSAMKSILKTAEHLHEGGEKGFLIDPSKDEDKKYIMTVHFSNFDMVKLQKAIKSFWRNEEAFMKAAEHPSMYQILSSTSHSLDKVDQILKADYVPTKEDVIRCRIITNGLSETKFRIDGYNFAMFDMSGQRNQRKKWIYCTDEIAAVVFFVAVNDYDQMLYEDNSVNRLIEAIGLFENICNSEWFTDSKIFLFLNKKDLFEEKIKTVSLKTCFEDYDGPENDSESALNFIKGKFLERFDASKSQIDVYFTKAIDTGDMRNVFCSLKKKILKKAIQSIGFT